MRPQFLKFLLLAFLYLFTATNTFAAAKSCKTVFTQPKPETFVAEIIVEGNKVGLKFEKGLGEGYIASFDVNGSFNRGDSIIEGATGRTILVELRNLLYNFVDNQAPPSIIMKPAIEDGLGAQRLMLYKYAARTLQRKYGGTVDDSGPVISWSAP